MSSIADIKLRLKQAKRDKRRYRATFFFMLMLSLLNAYNTYHGFESSIIPIPPGVCLIMSLVISGVFLWLIKAADDRILFLMKMLEDIQRNSRV